MAVHGGGRVGAGLSSGHLLSSLDADRSIDAAAGARARGRGTWRQPRALFARPHFALLGGAAWRGTPPGDGGGLRRFLGRPDVPDSELRPQALEVAGRGFSPP